jgi:hypothetical protein
MLVVLMYTVESEPGEIFDIELDENLKRANEAPRVAFMPSCFFCDEM